MTEQAQPQHPNLPTDDMDEALASERKQRYVSRPGFETTPLIRGFDQIRPLWDILEAARTGHPGEDCFICGGYSRWCASVARKPVEAMDVDVFTTGQGMFDHLRTLLEGESGQLGQPRHENDVSLTYNRAKTGPLAYVPPVQLIKPQRTARLVTVGTRQEILENFDFTVIRACIQSPTEVLVDADFRHDEEHHILRLKNIHCPVSSTLRCMKYAAKGYWLKPTECLKLFLDWDARDDTYRATLARFLTTANDGDGLSKTEIEHMEALMRID